VHPGPEETLPCLALWPLSRPRLLGRLPGSARNINVLVEDSAGARYVLRGCRRNPSRDRIIFQLDFQDHLRQHGVPVPQVVASAAGEGCVDAGPGSLWVLFRFVDGHHYQHGNRMQLRRAAGCLARIHAAGAGFTARPVQDETIPDLLRWWTHGEEEIAGLRGMFGGAGVDAELDFLDSWRAALTRDLPLVAVDRLPRAWLHADFHPRNVIFARDQVRAVLDFDVVHYGFRLADIAYAMHGFCQPDRTGPATAAAEASAAFLQAFDLTDPERRALPAFLVAVHARTAARYRVREREGTDPRGALRTHVRRMRALTAAAALGVPPEHGQ
jgi:Ser/Thr protein kinase RdoA (MazF antagonist)